jgi:hypothetical protein
MQPEVQDNLRVRENPKILDLFSANETLLFSGELLKINKKKIKQKRKMIITTQHIYNMRDDHWWNVTLSSMGMTS